MKFTTATCFILTSGMLWGLSQSSTRFGAFLVSTTSVWLLLVTGIVLLGIIFGGHFCVELLFRAVAYEDPQDIRNFPGYPSVATLTSFFLIALSGLVEVYNTWRKCLRLRLLGTLLMFVGSMAIFGYLYSEPPLYYFIYARSSAMALNTAFLFLVTGYSIYRKGCDLYNP